MQTLTLVSCLILAAGASAQATATLVTDTDVGVFATAGNNPTVLKSAAKGTTITSTPLSLSSQGRGTFAGMSVAILSRSSGIGSVRIAETARVDSRATNESSGTAATTDPKLAKQAPHSFLLTLTGIRSSSLDVTMVSTVAGGGKGSVQVDIGADGNVEYTQAADGKAYRTSIKFTGTSVKVRITISGDASTAGASYSMNVSVSPTPLNPNISCLLTRYGRSCPAVRLFGRDVPTSGNHVLNLQIQGAIPGKPIALALGATTAEIRLPGSSCILLTSPLVIVGMTADTAGKATTKLTFATSVQGTAYLQAVPYDPSSATFRSSNGLRVDCL